jgi:hypothetical protein
MTTDELAGPHQLDAGRVALLNMGQVGFLKLTVHPKRVGVDKRDLVLAHRGVVAQLR